MYLKCLMLMAFASLNLASKAQEPKSDKIKVAKGQLSVQPINHATLILSYQGKNVYVDPVGGAGAFKGLPGPDVIIITHPHGDHFDVPTLEAITRKKVTLIVPQSVNEKLSDQLKQLAPVVLNNGQSTTVSGIQITAVPMYNLPQTPDAFHVKGWGNGYVLNIGGSKVYVSGDTEDIPEMRSLQGIDVAFVCMNLPYTMDVQQAASAVLDFKPKIVYPYHYRGQDVNKFKEIVNNANPAIDVRLRDWYGSK